MGSTQTQNEISRLDSEIARYSSQIAQEQKKEADLMTKIARVSNSVNKNTSLSQLQSKEREIKKHNVDISKSRAKQSDIMAKIAVKQKRKVDLVGRLQREMKTEAAREARIAKQKLDAYFRQVQGSQVRISPPLMSMDRGTVELYSEEEYDVFISHATEDKETFVKNLDGELRVLGIKSWYDSHQVKWGDSLRKSIDEGLKKSRFGIVVISKNYIADGKYWTKKELDGLFQKESIHGKVILPIWHDITKAEVMEFSPLVAGKSALKTSDYTPKEIALELQLLLSD